jgi:hypothetical protein
MLINPHRPGTSALRVRNLRVRKPSHPDFYSEVTMSSRMSEPTEECQMTKKVLSGALGIALLVPAFAFAEVQAVNGEAGMIFKDEPSAVTREQVRAAINAPVNARGHWRFSGGEAGWNHNEARFVFDGGEVAHASDCPIVATLSLPRATGGPSMPLPPYRGA